MWSSFNHGQTCCAGSRIYVQASIYDKFTQKFTDYIKKLKLGNPLEQDVAQGPQVSQLQFDVRIQSWVLQVLRDQ